MSPTLSAKISAERAKQIVEKAAQEANDVLQAAQSDPLKKPKQMKPAVKEEVAKIVESGDPSKVVQYIKGNKKDFISGVYMSWFMKEIRSQLEGGPASAPSAAGAAAPKEEKKKAAPSQVPKTSSKVLSKTGSKNAKTGSKNAAASAKVAEKNASAAAEALEAAELTQVRNAAASGQKHSLDTSSDAGLCSFEAQALAFPNAAAVAGGPEKRKRQKQHASPSEAADHESASEAEEERHAKKTSTTCTSGSHKDVGTLQSPFRGGEAKADDSKTAMHTEAISSLQEMTAQEMICNGQCNPLDGFCLSCKSVALDAAVSPPH